MILAKIRVYANEMGWRHNAIPMQQWATSWQPSRRENFDSTPKFRLVVKFFYLI